MSARHPAAPGRRGVAIAAALASAVLPVANFVALVTYASTAFWVTLALWSVAAAGGLVAAIAWRHASRASGALVTAAVCAVSALGVIAWWGALLTVSAEDDAYTPASLTPDERAALCEQHASPWRAPSALANARIVFASWCDTDSALFVVAADGTGLTRLTPADSWSADPAATRDGREVVFSTAAGGSSLDLAAIDVRFLETTLLRTGGGADEAPALSPDGRRLAFVKRSGCELLLLFPRDPCETARLMVSSSRGEAAVTVYRLPTGDATRPAWSPQGDLIAFSADTGDGFHDLFVIRPDGRGLHALTTTPERDEREPAWSPNGRWIAFGCGDDVDDRRAVCVMPSAGGEARRLTPGDGSFAPSPAWSPDGEWIAYSAVTGDDEDVWLMRSDGQQPRLVARTAGLDERPAWLPG